jgi:hypothetical protein
MGSHEHGSIGVVQMYSNFTFRFILYLDSYRIEIHGYHEGHYPKYAQSTAHLKVAD